MLARYFAGELKNGKTLTQQEIARGCEVSQPSISMWLREGVPPERARILADTLKLNRAQRIELKAEIADRIIDLP